MVHARKAWLKGLSPKDNRSVPPLDYPLVYELKRAYPDLTIAINGGIADLAAASEHLKYVDGAMLGRAAYRNPELLIDVDPGIFGEPSPVADAFQALEAYFPYVERELRRGARLHDMTRHLVGLFSGRSGARLYRQRLATLATRRGAGVEALSDAMAAVSREPVAAWRMLLAEVAHPRHRVRPRLQRAKTKLSSTQHFIRTRLCVRPVPTLPESDSFRRVQRAAFRNAATRKLRRIGLSFGAAASRWRAISSTIPRSSLADPRSIWVRAPALSASPPPRRARAEFSRRTSTPTRSWPSRSTRPRTRSKFLRSRRILRSQRRRRLTSFSSATCFMGLLEIEWAILGGQKR